MIHMTVTSLTILLVLAAYAPADEATPASIEEPTQGDAVPQKTPARPLKADDIKVPDDVDWRRDFLSGLDWGIDGDDATRIIASKGLELSVCNTYRYADTGVVIHEAELPGQQLVYCGIRVECIHLTFADRKLAQVSFQAVNESDSDRLYALANTLFGPGIERRWEDDSAAKRIQTPMPSMESMRYFTKTAAISTVDYVWRRDMKRLVRVGWIELRDWKRTDRAFKRNHSLEAALFERFYKEARLGI